MARTLLLTSFHHHFINTSHTQFLGVLWLTYQLATSYVVFLSSLSLLHEVFTGVKLDLVLITWSSAVSTWKHCNVTLTWKTKSVVTKSHLIESKNPLSTNGWPVIDHTILILFEAANLQYQVDSKPWLVSPYLLVTIVDCHIP